MTATSEKSTLNGAPARAELRAPRLVAPHGRRRPLFVVAGIVDGGRSVRWPRCGWSPARGTAWTWW